MAEPRWLILLATVLVVPALAQSNAKRQTPDDVRSASFVTRHSELPRLHPCGLIREDPRTVPWMVEDKLVPGAPRRLSGSGDLSSQMPPVGDQGQQGSCTAWATGYYQKTHYEYREHHWNDSTSNHEFSPAFIYNQINGGADQGSSFTDAFSLMIDQGCASLADCSYNQSDYTTWPSESAYARAIPYRGSTSHYFQMTDTNGIKTAKVRIDSGLTTVIGISVYSNFDNIENYGYKYCVADTYGGNRGGHAITIVGYNDTISTNDGKGAFRFINSWGTSWGQSGYAWMSYVAARNSMLSQQYGFYLDDRTGYSPKMIGRVKITHSARDRVGIRLGVGPKSTPKWSKDFRTWRYPRASQAFPNHNIVFDMTEGESYITNGQTDSVFVRAIDDSSDGKKGTINYFSATHLAWNSTGVSPDTPVSIPDQGYAYARARIPRPHDVGVTAIIAPTGVVDSGTVVTPKARVKNFGADTATFRVKFRIGTTYTDSQSVSNLLPGDSVQVSFTNWTALQRGTSTTRCSTALSSDSNHTNDTLSGSVRVKVTNVGVTAIIAPTGTIDSGTVVTPKARAKNFGTDAATFPVKFRIGSSYSDSQAVTSLAAGDSVLVSFTNWTATQRGVSVTRCTTALSGDQNHANDTLSGSVTVKVTNVGVTAIIAPTGTIDSGTVVAPKARVKNYGTNAATFPVKFRIGSFYSDSQTVTSLAAGDSIQVSFTNWTATQRGASATRCTTALSGDQNHANDTMSGSVRVKVTNVGVTAIIAPTDTVDSGVVVTPKARIKNFGTDAASFRTFFRVGSVYSDSQNVSNLAAGDSVQISFTNWTPTQLGTFTKRCSTALSGDQVHSNDTLSGSVTVKRPTVIDVGVTAIIAPTGTIDSGTVVTPKARVKNYGTNAATFPVKFRIGSFYSDSQTVSNLSAGDSVQISFTNWTATQRGISATCCTTAFSSDQNHANDTLSGSVTVRVTDVGVTTIVTPTGTVDSGTVVTPKARVKNYGTNAATFPVKFRIDAFYSDSQTVTSLAAGDSVQVSFTDWTATQRGTSVTRCTTALSGDQIHTNDTLSGSVTVRVTDVGVTTIVTPTGTIDSGTVVTPKARVKNYGTGSATFPVTFRIGSGYTNTQTVTSLGAGDSIQISFTNWTATQRGTSVTRCSTALSGDQNHSNDTLSGSVRVKVTNVGVTAIVAPTDTVDSGIVVTPKARIKNFGTDTASFRTFFRVGSVYSDSQNVSSLAAGDSVTMSFTNWTPTQLGTFAKRCSTALSGDQVHSNDTLSGSVTVKRPTVIDVGVTVIIAPTGTIDSGTVVAPKARVKNYGTNAATFPVKFRIGSVYSDSQTVTGLAAGDSVQVSFTNWTAGQRGTYVTRCTTALSGDQHNNNDSLSGSVTVKVTNVGVTAIIAPTGTIDSGTVVTPKARVKNYGTNVATFPVKFRIGSFYSDSQTVTSLAAGDSVQVSFTNWTAVQRGSSVTRCSTALSGDQVHSNDTLSGSVTVRVTDVGVTTIVTPTGTIDSGTVVAPKARVKNYGTNAATFPVKLRIGSFYSDSQTVTSLAAGDSVQVSFTNWTAVQRGTSVTRCTIALSSDQNHANDTLSGSVRVKVTNVGVTAIIAPTDTVDSGTVITPKAKVKNFGTDAASFRTFFRIGSVYSDSQNVSSLAAGDSMTVSFTNWTPTQLGTFVKRCSTALSGDQIHSNDTLSGSVTVKRPTVIDVGVTAIIAPTDTIDSGTVVTPKARVKNYGTNAATFPVKFRIGASYSDSQTVTGLAAGDSVQVSFANWTAAPRGVLATRCSTALANDQVHSNDTLSGSVTVKVTNVGVTAIVVPTGTIDSGTVVTPKARVKNCGTNAATFPVKFRIGSFYSDSQTVSNLAAGDSVQVSFTNWTATQRGTSVTRCTTALSGDQNHANDTMSGSVTVRVTDVGVRTIATPTGTIDSGTVVTPKARVKNYGTNAATFPVKFRVGSFYSDSQTVTSLAAGDSVQVSFTNWTATQRGASATRCTTALSGDQNHANDTMSGSVRVKVTNVGVSAIIAPTDTVDSGTIATPKAKLKNFGTDTASFRTFFRVGSVYSDSQNVSSLAAGDSVTVSFTNWTPTQLGTFTKRCSTALSGDQVHSDDTMSGSVTVKRPTVIDVGVTAIIAPTGTIDSGTVVTPKARVKNYGSNAATFPVKFRIGSFYSDSQTVTNLAAGDSIQVSFTNWTAIQRGTSATRCTTALSGDQHNNNDSLSGSVTVKVTNVGVTAIIAPTGTIDSGTVVTPKARVKNYGTNAATFPVKFRIGSFYSDSQTVSNLAAGDSVQVSFTNWTATQRGTSVTRCTTALSGDQAHSNDTLSGSVRVRVANVGVTVIVAPTDTVDSGVVVTPKAKVKNFGTDAASFRTFFRIGSIYSDSQNVSSLAAGDSVQVSFANWTPMQLGTYVKRCSTALSGDQVHSNDTLSGSVTVKRPTLIDVGVTAIIAPTGAIDSGTVVTPKAKVKNYGTNTATFPVKFRVGASYTDTQTVSNLAAGDSLLVSFDTWTAGQRGTYATRCTTALNGDQHNNNDSLSGSVTVKVTNVGITAIIAPSDTVDSGTVVTPKARVKNYGSGAATFPVFFRIGSFYSDSQTVSNLAAGDSVQISFTNWTPTQLGTFNKRCTTALNGDQVHSNDILSGSVTVMHAPVTDVGVTEIVAPSGTIDSGTVVTPKARVKNYGTSAASFPVTFRIGSFYSNSQDVTNLPAGDSILVSFADWSALQRGTNATRCTTALTGDENHSDDALSGSVSVRVKNVGVAAIIAPTGTLDSGATIAPQARVRNYGTGAATLTVTFRIDSLYSDSQNVSNLAAEDSALVTFAQWTATARGTNVTRCSTALSGDVNPANDTLSGPVTVRVRDVACKQLLAPPDTVDSGATVTPRAVVRNVGTTNETLNVRFCVGADFADTVSLALAAGATDTIGFADWTALTPGTFPTRCVTMLPTDMNPANDSLADSVVVQTYTGVAELQVLPKLLALERPRPEPMRGQATIRFSIPNRTQASVTIRSITGALVRTVCNSTLQPAFYSLTWDGCDNSGRSVAPGVYFWRLECGGKILTRKAIKID